MSDSDDGDGDGPNWAKMAAEAAAKKAAKQAAKEARQIQKELDRAARREGKALRAKQQLARRRRRTSVGPYNPKNTAALRPGVEDQFSLDDRHRVLELASRMEAGDNVEFFIWPALRKVLRGNLSNITALASRIRGQKAAQGQFQEFQPHCVAIIEQVINAEITIDHGAQLSCANQFVA